MLITKKILTKPKRAQIKKFETSEKQFKDMMTEKDNKLDEERNELRKLLMPRDTYAVNVNRSQNVLSKSFAHHGTSPNTQCDTNFHNRSVISRADQQYNDENEFKIVT